METKRLKKIKRKGKTRVSKDTMVIIEEFRRGLLISKPTYNSSIILFRTILIHICNEIDTNNLEEVTHFGFSDALKYIDSKTELDKNELNKVWRHKNLSNRVTHNLEVLTKEHEEVFYDLWDFIKYLVESEIYLQRKQEKKDAKRLKKQSK